MSKTNQRASSSSLRTLILFFVIYYLDPDITSAKPTERAVNKNSPANENTGNSLDGNINALNGVLSDVVIQFPDVTNQEIIIGENEIRENDDVSGQPSNWTLYLNLTSIQCNQLSIDSIFADVELGISSNENEFLELLWVLHGMSASCSMNWQYNCTKNDSRFQRNENDRNGSPRDTFLCQEERFGRAHLMSSPSINGEDGDGGSDLTSVSQFLSPGNFDQNIEIQLSMIKCKPTVSIDFLSITHDDYDSYDDVTLRGDGNINKDSSNEFKILRIAISKAFEDILCSALNTLTEQVAAGVLNDASVFFMEHQNYIPRDPLSSERDMLSQADSANHSLNLVNWTSADRFNSFVDEMNKVLVSTVLTTEHPAPQQRRREDGVSEDSREGYNNPVKIQKMPSRTASITTSSTKMVDLGVNEIIRNLPNFQNGAFSIPLESLAKIPLTSDIHLLFKEIRIFGLDTIRHIQLLNPIGDYTLQNRLTLSSLRLEVDFIIDIQTTLSQESLLIFKEDFDSLCTLSLGFLPPTTGDDEGDVGDTDGNGIEVDLSFLVAMDVNRINAIPLSPLLHTSQILPCLLTASINTFEIAKIMTRIPQNVQLELGIQNFLSTTNSSNANRLDRIMNEVVAPSFVTMYKQSILNSLPSFLDSTLRNALNDAIHNYHKSLNDENLCPIANHNSKEFVDISKMLQTTNSQDSSQNHSNSKASLKSNDASSDYGNIPGIIKQLLDVSLFADDPKTGLALINEVLIKPLTKQQSGTEGKIALMEEPIINQTIVLSINTFHLEVEFGLWDTVIENVDELMNLAFLETDIYNPYTTHYQATVGGYNKPLTITTLMRLKMKGPGLDSRNEMKLGIEIHDAQSKASFLSMVNATSFLTLPLQFISDIHCWLAMIPPVVLDQKAFSATPNVVTAAITALNLNPSDFKVTSTCVDCSSPGMVELSQLLSLENSEEQKETSNLMNDKVLGLEKLLLSGGLAQNEINKALNNARIKCPLHSNEGLKYHEDIRYEDEKYVDTAVEPVMKLLLNGIIAISIVLLVLKFQSWMIRWKYNRWLRQHVSDEDLYIKHQQELILKDDKQKLNKSTSSMFRSKYIPRWVRFLMPIIIVTNVLFFYSGHISLGASLQIYFELAGERMIVDDFYSFSVVQSVKDMWTAGSHELAIITILFAGVWPYVKQLVAFYLWFAPTWLTSIHKRGGMYIWLNDLAKLSMFDVFVTMITTVAFRVTIQSPDDYTFLPSRFYYIDLVTKPLWGLYANMIAQVISQVSSHVILHYQRVVENEGSDNSWGGREISKYVNTGKDVAVDEINIKSAITKCNESNKSVNDDDANQEEFIQPLCHHRYILDWGMCHYNRQAQQQQTVDNAEEQLDLDSRIKFLQTKSIATILVGLIGIIAFASIVCGCIMPNFRIEIFGLVGQAVEVGKAGGGTNSDAIQLYSLFTIFQKLWDQAILFNTAGDYFGHASMILLLLITILLVPILLVVALLILWFVPLARSKRNRMMVFLEIIRTWKFLEVYIFALLMACWQLGEISEFLLNDYCKSLENTLRALVYYGIVPGSDGQCMYLQPNLEPGAFALMFGSAMLILLNNFVMQAERKQHHDLGLFQTQLQRRKQLKTEVCLPEKKCTIKKIEAYNPKITDTCRFLFRRVDVQIGVPLDFREGSKTVT